MARNHKDVSPLMREIVQMLQAHSKHSFVLVHSPTIGAQLTIEHPKITLKFSTEHPGEIWIAMDLDLSAEQARQIMQVVGKTG